MKSLILFIFIFSNIVLAGGNSGGGGVRPERTNPELQLAGGIFENQILVKYLSEKASEIKFGVAVKENGSWITEVHALRPEEFTTDNQNILDAISSSKIKNGNWVKSK